MDLNNSLIEINDLNFTYDRVPVLKNVNLTIKAGDFIGIIGPNGSGKTTFLKLLLGLYKPTKGEIIFKKKVKMSYVPQIKNFNSIMNISVYNVITLPLSGSSIFSKYHKDKYFDNIVKVTRIKNFLKIPFIELSGGQQQRVLIARSLLQRPDIVLLDEPNTGIDAFTTNSFYNILKEIYKVYKFTIIMVSHDLNIIPTICESVFCVFNGEINVHSEPKKVFECPVFDEMLGSNLELLIHGHSIPHRVVPKHKHEKNNGNT
ncbi:metal ABC transporter ATP-binding protein [bacterium]|nr:metal ABC transporter ATP-binding protein [bacterium]